MQTGPGHSIVCSGGASSWQDLALLLIARHAGTEEAIRISKLFLYQWHRDGQLPYASMIANVDHGDAAIVRCQTWLAQNYERADIVAELVRRSGLPKRTFDRRFRAATGYSPLAYVQALRIEEAKQLLETGTATGRGDRARGRLRGHGVVPPPVPPAGRHDARRLPAQVPAADLRGARACRSSPKTQPRNAKAKTARVLS